MKKVKGIYLLIAGLFLLMGLSVSARESLDSFSFKEDKKEYFVYYDRNIAQVRNKTYQQGGEKYIDTVFTRLSNNKSDKTEYLIRAVISKKRGVGFVVLEKKTKGFEPLYELWGDYIAIPGDGTIRTFSLREYSVPEVRNFFVKSGALTEVEFDFTYINFDTKANKDFTAYNNVRLAGSGVKISDGEVIKVIGRSGSSFYVVTPEGKAGWVEIPLNTKKGQSPIKGLYPLKNK